MTMDLSPNAPEDQTEFATFYELDHLGGVMLRLDGLVPLWPGDYIQPVNKKQMLMVDNVEHVDDLFESFTLATTSVMFSNHTIYTTNLKDFFPGWVVIKAGMQRKMDWALLWGDANYKSGTS